MKKTADYLTMLAVFLIPFGVLWAGAGSIHQKQANAVLVAALLVVAFRMGNRWLVAVGLYLTGWLCFAYSMVFSGFWHPAMAEVNQAACVLWLVGMLVFVGIYESRVPLSRYADGICISALVMCAFIFLQVSGHDPLSSYLSIFTSPYAEKGFSFRTPAGIAGNSNFAGAFLAVSVPFFLRGKWRWCLPVVLVKGTKPYLDWPEWQWRFPIKKHNTDVTNGAWHLCLPVLFAGLLLAHSAMSWIAVIVGMFFYFFGFWGLFGGLAVSAAFLLTIDHHRFNAPLFENERFAYWKDAIEKTLYSWKTVAFGYGPGISWKPDNKVHSEYVAAFFNFGLVGLSLVAGYAKSVLRAPRMLLTALLILAVNSIGNHPFHVPATVMLALMVMALTQREIDVSG